MSDQLPYAWECVRLAEVAETSLGKMLDRAKFTGLSLVPYLRNVNVQWDHIDTNDLRTMEITDEDRERFEVAGGDLLVCEGGEIGRAAIWQGRSGYIAYQKALHRVRSRGQLNLKFLRYLLEYYANNGTLARYSTGSTIAHLPQQRLRELPVPLPSPDVQLRIVDILEDHLSRLDAAHRYIRSGQRRLSALRSANLDSLFGTNGSTARLSDMVQGIEAGRSFGGSASPASPDQWGIIKVSAMTWGEFKASENKAVPASRVDQRFEIKQGDLLVSRANTNDYVGASVLVGVVRPKLLLSDKSLRIKVREGVDREWLWRALQSPAARIQISQRATGTKDSMRNISQSSLLSIVLPERSLSEQQQAAMAYRELDGSNRLLAEGLDHAERRLGGLQRALLAAAFAGKLTGGRSDTDVIKELAHA